MPNSDSTEELQVHPEQVLTGWDTFLLMAPFSALLAAWMFRLDEIVAAPRKKRRRAFSLTNLNGRAAFTDPDGKPWKFAPKPRCGLRHGPEPVENFTLEGQF